MYFSLENPNNQKFMGKAKMNTNEPRKTGQYSTHLEAADGYGEVWNIVKETVQAFLGKSRIGMMLFLEDLPLSLGAYHPVGTNNIVLNKSLVELVESTVKSKIQVNAFIYTLLVHEYLHALGYLSEDDVRRLVLKISRASFGEKHVAAEFAEHGPWTILNGVPIIGLPTPKRTMEIVKDFERPNRDYIV